jgi:D-aspartate ligase
MNKDVEVAEPSLGPSRIDPTATATCDRAPGSGQKKPPGAVVLGGDYRALTVARSLGRHGIPVWIFPEDQKIAAKSRYALTQIPLPYGDENEQSDFLLEIGERYGLDGWVLFPTEDNHAAMLARQQAKLAGRFRLATSPWETVEIAYDKRSTYRVAQKLGVHCPATHYPRDRREVEILECSFPVILKPAIKEAVNRFTREKAWPIEDRASLLAHYDVACTLVDPGLIMIQELIPGAGESQFSYGAICENGRPLASVVARRTRQYPVDFGRSSSFVETVEAPAVEEAARRLLEGLRYTGLIEAEFKYDSRDHRYKLLDLNPRVWGWHTLARPGGVDFPYFLWRLAQHLAIPEIRVKAGYRWMRMTTDLPAAMREIMRGRISVASYLRSLRPPLEFAVFAVDDPIPFLLEVPLLLMARSAQRLHEFRRGATARPVNANAAAPKLTRVRDNGDSKQVATSPQSAPARPTVP